MSDYYMIDGQQVPRVTHVIRSVLVAPALQAWRERRIAELACEGGRTPERVLAEIRSDRTAMERGSQVHRWIAAALVGNVTLILTIYAVRWSAWHREHRTWKVLEVEQPVTTVQRRAAGTLDAMFSTREGRVLVDWKTTENAPLDRPWLSHVAQLGAYASMSFTWTDEGRTLFRFTRPARGAVVYLTPDGYRHHTVDLDEAVRLWEHVLGVYEIATHQQTNGQKGNDEMSPLKSAGEAPPTKDFTDRPDLKNWLGKVVILEPIRERTIPTKYNATTEVTDCLAWAWNEKTEEVEEIGEVDIFWGAIRAQLHDAIAGHDQVVGTLKMVGKRMELEPVPEAVLEQIAPKFF
jgi:hypothetical protein